MDVYQVTQWVKTEVITTQTFVSSCALARLSTAMAKKTFSRVSVVMAVRSKYIYRDRKLYI